MSNPAPKILSLEFHLKFFPRFLLSRLLPNKKEERGVRFSNNLEFMIILAACVMLAAIGIPLVLKNGSLAGWVMGILGIGGCFGILMSSVIPQLGTKPSFDSFFIWTFLFFIFLGITAGICVGRMEHSLFLSLLSDLLGFFVGYWVGIGAGLGFQYLGWIAIIVDMFLGCAIIGIVIVDLILLFVK